MGCFISLTHSSYVFIFFPLVLAINFIKKSFSINNLRRLCDLSWKKTAIIVLWYSQLIDFFKPLLFVYPDNPYWYNRVFYNFVKIDSMDTLKAIKIIVCICTILHHVYSISRISYPEMNINTRSYWRGIISRIIFKVTIWNAILFIWRSLLSYFRKPSLNGSHTQRTLVRTDRVLGTPSRRHSVWSFEKYIVLLSDASWTKSRCAFHSHKVCLQRKVTRVNDREAPNTSLYPISIAVPRSN